MADKKKIEVTIDGRNFTVIGTDDEEYIRNLSYYVDKRIKELVSKNAKLSPTMAATLAALNIADELNKVSQKYKELKSNTKEPLEDFEKVVVPLIPMGQLIQPEDIAETILFLASEQARMITGQVIKVSGGKAL